MDPLHTRLQTVLAEKRYSLTAPRLAVFDTLVTCREPLTIQQICALLHHQTDRATVYRTIDMFVKIGVADRLPTGLKYRYELGGVFRSHHHHITCLGCGAAASFEDEVIEKSLASIATSRGYTVHAHQLEVQGMCVICSTKSNRKTS